MTIFLYVVAAIFAFGSVALFVQFAQSRHPGVLLAGVTFGGAAFFALYLVSWWPLLIGFALGWLLRLIGGDPGYKA